MIIGGNSSCVSECSLPNVISYSKRKTLFHKLIRYHNEMDNSYVQNIIYTSILALYMLFTGVHQMKQQKRTSVDISTISHNRENFLNTLTVSDESLWIIRIYLR